MEWVLHPHPGNSRCPPLQITNSMDLLDTLITVNAAIIRATAAGGGSGGGEGGTAANSLETRVYTMAQDLEDRLPEKVDIDAVLVCRFLPATPNPILMCAPPPPG